MNPESGDKSHERMDQAGENGPEGVAIIGMAGRFPGAPDVESFWRNLVQGRDTISRWAAPDAGAEDRVQARGVLEDAALFDAEFFGVSPHDADRMDPQHRLFLETCAGALMNAGYDSHAYAGEIGLFAGCSLNTYLMANLLDDREALERLTENYQVGEFSTFLGNDKDFMTTRAAYKLDLRGPVVSVQSACATSLVAVCQAAQSLLNYGCDMALAGGVSVTFPQQRGHSYQEGGLASGDGTCRPFDAQATGTVFGHGVGVVVLKRLEDALRDGDPIEAVLRGFAVNNDGAQKAGYMAPGVDGQTRVIRAAQAMAGFAPETISYVEAHGTGTPMGDPIEIAALCRAFGEESERTGYCTVGTAKGNVGHLDSAAGVTGLIKTVLQLKHRIIPGVMHFQHANPELSLEGSPFRIAQGTAAWDSAGPRRAGVSAFGVGGVNAHVVLEEAPVVRQAVRAPEVRTLCVSARTAGALERSVEALRTWLCAHPEAALEDVAFTLQHGRRAFQHRIAVGAESVAEAIAALRQARGAFVKSEPRAALLFSGQGSQFQGMGKELYRTETLYRETFDACAEEAQALLGVNLRTVLDGSESNEAELDDTAFAQPALFATGLALARLLESRGVKAEAVAGHSLGEYVAATVAGVFTWQDALRLVCARGRLMAGMARGAMVSVRLAEAELAPYVNGGLEIAAVNSPRACVLGGPLAEVERLEATLARDRVAFQRLRTSHAFHTASMEPMLAEFAAAFEGVALKAPSTPLVSSVTGRWMLAEEAADARYWVSQCRKPVRFGDVVRTLLDQGCSLLLEAGPGNALTSLALHQREREDAWKARTVLPRPAHGEAAHPWAATLGELWMEGVAVAWNTEAGRRVALPAYPFERTLHWVEPARSRTGREDSIEVQGALSMVQSTEKAGAAGDHRAPSRGLRLRGEIAALFAEISGIVTGEQEAGLPFIELGFDSLFLTQATQAVNKRFGVKLTFRQLVEQYGTVAALAERIDSLLPPETVRTVPPALSNEPLSGAARKGTMAVGAAGSSTMEQLLSEQLAALSELFAQQVTTLRQAAGLTENAPSAIASPVTAKTAVPPAATEVRHGSFRPLQPRAQAELTGRQESYIARLIARYESRTPGSKRLTQASRAHLADPRAVAGYRAQWKEMVYPLVTDRAKGSRIWDVDGNEYIDIVNGYGCVMFGHSPEFVVAAAREQLDRGVAIGPQSALAGEVAALLCELTGNERVTFCNTGSEAVMAAMRVARTVTGRDRIVYFSGDYHGTFDEVLLRRTPNGSTPIAPGIPAANTSNVTVLEYGSEESLAYLRAHGAELAAVLVEPVQTRNPGLQPIEFLREVRNITEAAGAAMILDEVVTGFRLAPGGVQAEFGIRADLCTYGKVIGGGHPIGVLSGRAEYLDALDGGAWQYGDDSGPEVGVTFFAGTFVRHPLALAAVRAVLTHLKEQGPGLQRELNRRTAELAGALDRFFTERGVPARVHHFASWFYFTFPHEARLGSLLYYAMRAKGIHIQESYPCFLTTAHTDADLAAVEQAFRETIVEMQEAGVLPGGPLEATAAVVCAPAATPAPALSARPAMHVLALASAPQQVPLTEPQREVFLAATLSDAANCAFNESLTLWLNGPVRREALTFALDAAIARHDCLRATVCNDGESLCFGPVFGGAIEWIDLAGQHSDRQQAQLSAHVAREAETPFDLHHGPLLRAACFLFSETSAAVALTAHHLVLDGWSANQLLEEIGRIYSEGTAALTQLAPLLPFSSFAVRERARLQAGEFADNERFWVDRFAGRSPRLDLPTDRPRPREKSYAGETFAGTLDAALYAELKQLSAAQGCSLYVTLLSSFQLLLHKLTGQDEVVVGISTAAQALLDEVSLVGHCVNFLPMLSVLADGETAQQHLRATRTALLDAYDHQEFTYGSLLGKLKLEREGGRLPLIEVQFNLERVGTAVHFAELATRIQVNPKSFVNTDLFLNVVESADGLALTCDFNRELFDRATIARWMALWEQLLRSEVAQPTAAVSELEWLPEAERSLVLHEWNRTALDLGGFEPVYATFLRHAQQHPERVAVQCAGRTWSYGELAEYATLLARRLLREGLVRGGLVGLCMERSLEMVGSMLAVMLAGGAYLPLDPSHPRERLALVMRDSGLKLLLAGRDPNIDTTARILKVTGPQQSGGGALPGDLRADELAYVIYTSGSTGVPKGVAIEHGALTNLLRSMQREPGFTADDVMVAVTTLSFDIAALELLLPLTAGGRVVIATEEQVCDGLLLLDLLEQSGATVLQATPGAWRLLLDAGWSGGRPLKVLCGGEALPRELAGQLLARSADVWNVYGPTETTIWSTATRVQSGTGPLSIGPGIANTTLYVLDEARRPVPVGVAGELYIGGAGLARGYWNRAELTAEKFVANPFGAGRLYRTGDLARWRGDGRLELLGRADFQVKLRGYRIELGDIEAALLQLEPVREACVVRQAEGDAARLAGFIAAPVMAAETPARLAEEVRAALGRTLPDYMIPQAIHILSELPRTPNGKLDRKAMMSMAAADASSAGTVEKVFEAPADEREAALARVWGEVLGMAAVSTNASIFELGADSLAIFRIAARLQREGVPVKSTHIFTHRTIAALGAWLASLEVHPDTGPKAAAPRIAPASREAYKLTKVRLHA